MPYNLDQLDFLGVRLGVVIPPEFIENKRREQDFIRRSGEIAARAEELNQRHDAGPLQALLQQATDAAGGKNFAAALDLLDQLEAGLAAPDLPPPPVVPPPPAPENIPAPPPEPVEDEQKEDAQEEVPPPVPTDPLPPVPDEPLPPVPDEPLPLVPDVKAEDDGPLPPPPDMPVPPVVPVPPPIPLPPAAKNPVDAIKLVMKSANREQEMIRAGTGSLGKLQSSYVDAQGERDGMAPGDKFDELTARMTGFVDQIKSTVDAQAKSQAQLLALQQRLAGIDIAAPDAPPNTAKLHQQATAELAARVLKAKAASDEGAAMHTKVAQALADGGKFILKDGVNVYTPEAFELPSILREYQKEIEQTAKRFKAAQSDLRPLTVRGNDLLALEAKGRPLTPDAPGEVDRIEQEAQAASKDFSKWNAAIIKPWRSYDMQVQALNKDEHAETVELFRRCATEFDNFSREFDVAGRVNQEIANLVKLLRESLAPVPASPAELIAAVKAKTEAIKGDFDRLEKPLGQLAEKAKSVAAKKKQFANVDATQLIALDAALEQINRDIQTVETNLSSLELANQSAGTVEGVIKKRFSAKGVDKKLVANLKAAAERVEKATKPALVTGKKALAELTALRNDLAAKRAALGKVAPIEETARLKESLAQLPKLPGKAELIPPGGAKAWKAETAKGGDKKSATLFASFTKAWEAADKKGDDKSFDALTKAAALFLKHYDSLDPEEQADATDTKRAAKAREAIKAVRTLRLQRELDALPAPPWGAKAESAARSLQTRVCLETGGGEENESRGASESYWVKDAKGKKAFIFKPVDGEADPSFGWKKGGGAAREVMMSSLNEEFKESLGLDFGVARTSMTTLENDSFASEKNGGNPKRTGAAQEFAPADAALTDGVKDQDPAVLSLIPPEETQKVLLMDFVTLQLDRQPNNFLVGKSPEGTPKLVPIDAGNALPSKKAFAAMRRSFTNNAAFAMPGADQPFSDEMQEKIAALDEDKIAASMVAANQTMAEVDPATEGMVDDENVEITKRSVRFLKQAAALRPPPTTKAIGELYAFYFHKVIDAEARQVNQTIGRVLVEYAADQGIKVQIDAIPDGPGTLNELGWPSDQFQNLRSDEPARLLAILQNRQVNPVVQKQIDDLIKQLGGRAKLGFNPDEGTFDRRLSNLRTALKNKENARREADPKLKKAAAANKIDFKIERVPGKIVDMTPNEKLVTLQRLEKFEAAGGDKGFKKQSKKNPAKMTFEEKIYESLGGDARMKEMEESGLNPYMSKKLEDRIQELELMDEFEALGGLDAYVRLGGPQNAELSMTSRLTIMRNLNRLEQ